MAELRKSPAVERWAPADRWLDRDNIAANLGLEPPIEAGGEPQTPADHRRVSLRWLAGTVITGLAGAALIGSAMYAALDYSARFAEAPEFVPRDRTASNEDRINQSNRGDRLARPVDIVAARQSFRAATTVKSGERELVRNRNFVRIGTTLAMTPVGFTSDVPAFNPLKLLGGDTQRVETSGDADTEREEADVSFVSQNLSSNNGPSADFNLTIEEIQAQVSEHLKSALGSGPSPQLPLPSQMLLMRTSRASLAPGPLGYASLNAPITSSPFSSIEVKMVPENVTVIHKYTQADAGPPDSTEKLVIVKRNESFEQILMANGANATQARAIANAFSGRRIQEGQKLKILQADMDGTAKMQIARLSLYADEALLGTIAMNDLGDYVLVEKSEAETPARRRPSNDDDDDNPGAMRLYNSFYETALKQQIPRKMIDELVRIFANDVDFNRAVTGGDAFEVFYTEPEERDGAPELLYASINARGETHRYYRYVIDSEGTVDYFDKNGRSNRKFLIRKPMTGGEQRSGFGWRRHPILGYSRMHTGVDWAAKTGTPIVAAGNGVVIKAKRESGYGNRVEIQHGNGYVTTYNHMVGFARNMREGLRVQQGQVIGYVGSTGLSTGAHLHYEVIVNGNYVDPLRIRLARTRQLTRQQVAEFGRERERIDSLMAKAPNATHVASSNATN